MGRRHQLGEELLEVLQRTVHIQVASGGGKRKQGLVTGELRTDKMVMAFLSKQTVVIKT